MKPAMRSIVIGTALALGVMAAPRAQVSIGISTPNISIGINVPTYPTMTVIPGYPVYYAPQVDANYFFYDGLYWVFANDNWYSSYWYNGPWTLVAPVYVPVYVLRVPVRYYRVVPVYFRGWHSEAPAALGRSLGPRLGTASWWLGPLGPRRCAAACTAPDLSAAIRGRALSAS